jgi:hypothetical protein
VRASRPAPRASARRNAQGTVVSLGLRPEDGRDSAPCRSIQTARSESIWPANASKSAWQSGPLACRPMCPASSNTSAEHRPNPVAGSPSGIEGRRHLWSARGASNGPGAARRVRPQPRL